MALIKCVECGKEISDKAIACPHCGCPMGKEQEDSKKNNESSQVEKEGKKEKISKNKKRVLIVGVIVLIVVVGGTIFYFLTNDNRNYEKANELYKKQNYQEAIVIYEKLKDYKDSNEFVKKCKKEIGMRKHADYEFLEKLEKSIIERMKKTSKEDYSYEQLVNTELAYLEKFKDASFYDKKIGKLAKRYLEGLNVQKKSLNAKFKYEEQIEWQRGMVIRKEALKSLHDEYKLLDDNSEFVGSYIKSYEDDKKLLDAYDAIEKDLGKQQKKDKKPKIKYYDESAEISYTFKNNTKYTYSTVYEFSFTTEKDKIFDSNSATIENIKPGQSYVVSVYVDFKNLDTDNFFWDYANYYTEVK